MESWALLGRSGQLLGRFWETPWLTSGTLRALLDGLGALGAHLSTQLSPYLCKLGKIGRLGASWAAILARLEEISIFPRDYPSLGELTPLRESGKKPSETQNSWFYMKMAWFFSSPLGRG